MKEKEMAADITTMSTRRSKPKTLAGAQKIIDRLERQVVDLHSLRAYVAERRDELSVENARLSNLTSDRFEEIKGLREEIYSLVGKTSGSRAAIVNAIRETQREFDQTFEFSPKERANDTVRVILRLLDALDGLNIGSQGLQLAEAAPTMSPRDCDKKPFYR